MNTKTPVRRTRVARLLVLLAALMVGIGGNAQDVMVTVMQKKPMLPSSLTALIDHPEHYINIMVQNTTNHEVDIYLKLSLTSDYSPNGTPLELHTQDQGTTRPRLILRPHEILRFRGFAEFEDHFSGRLTTNATQGDASKLIRIPEGTYRLCIEACRWQQQVYNDEVIAQQCLTYNVCYSASAPEITSPLMNVLSHDGSVPILEPTRLVNFRWTPVISNCLSNNRINYLFKIVKVMPGMSPDHAIDNAPVVYSHNCKSKTFLQIDTLKTLDFSLEHGTTYAAQVIATVSGNGYLEIANNGKSQIAIFAWGRADYDIGSRNHSLRPDLTGTQEDSIADNDRDEVIASIRKAYLVLPFRDTKSFDSINAKDPSEESKLPPLDSTSLIKRNGNYDLRIMNPNAKQFLVKWMPLRSSNPMSAEYRLSLYEDPGDKADLNGLTPLATKTLYPHTNDFTTSNPEEFNEPSWMELLERGKSYILLLTTDVNFQYHKYYYKTIVHYVDGIEADTEYDTVRHNIGDNLSFSSTLRFDWGIDSTLLDRVLPPQFVTPISMTDVACDDSSYTHFGSAATIKAIQRLDWVRFSWTEPQNLDIDDTASVRYHVRFWELPEGVDIDSCLRLPPRYAIDSLKGTTLPNRWMDSLVSGQNYVARVKMVIADTLKYNRCNGGWSQPLAFQFPDTSAHPDTNVVEGHAIVPVDLATLVPMGIRLKASYDHSHHSTALTWEYENDSPEDYHGVVYRAQGDGTFVNIGTFHRIERSFTDINPPAGAKCTYYIELLFSQGRHSTPSNRASIKTEKK